MCSQGSGKERTHTAQASGCVEPTRLILNEVWRKELILNEVWRKELWRQLTWPGGVLNFHEVWRKWVWRQFKNVRIRTRRGAT